MADPTELRVAAARARGAGGVVRAVSELADLVEQFCDQLAESESVTVWAARWRTENGEGIEPRDDEQDAREFIACLPQDVRPYWAVVRQERWGYAGPWVEVPGDV